MPICLENLEMSENLTDVMELTKKHGNIKTKFCPGKTVYC